jgi:hypothetical protein
LRETGHQDVDRELARLMNELFSQTRDDVRGRIKAFLEKVPPGKDGGPGIARTQDLPTLLEGSDPQTPPATSSPALASQSLPRWSWLLLAVATAIVGVVGLGRLGREIQIEDDRVASPGGLPLPDAGQARVVTAPASATSPAPTVRPTATPLPAPTPSRQTPLPRTAPPRAVASERPRIKVRVLDDDSP